MITLFGMSVCGVVFCRIATLGCLGLGGLRRSEKGKPKRKNKNTWRAVPHLEVFGVYYAEHGGKAALEHCYFNGDWERTEGEDDGRLLIWNVSFESDINHRLMCLKTGKSFKHESETRKLSGLEASLRKPREVKTH